MVNSLLFRWEDSQALQHHCGFCERPLSHPGARASCFGTHSEPCHRFHQAMFMRLRAHICNYCQTIDEAHYKRHHEIAVQLHTIYESSGELEWSIVPAEPGDPKRGRPIDQHPVSNESGPCSLRPDETPTSKRERKNAKCLARAANRAKLVTQEEIRYVESVLHAAESSNSGEGVDPANLEELQLIETHLRYNANVYNSHSSRRDLKQFAKISDVDVDFEGEIERVLDTFLITELVKRNLRNRGLLGKELRDFEVLVDTFKATIVEDLVLVKKDMMEVRMRRAGYMRYTNRTAYSIVKDRYIDKDWKTGERITSSSSDSSSLTAAGEDAIVEPVQVSDDTVPSVTLSIRGPDRRHLQHIHTRVSGDDGLGQMVIEPYHTPLLPLKANKMLKRPAVLQVKVVENKENNIPAGLTYRGWQRRDVARQTVVSQPSHKLKEIPLVQNPPSPPSIKPATSSTPTKSVWGRSDDLDNCSSAPSGRTVMRPTLEDEDFPSLGSTVSASGINSMGSSAPAVQAPVNKDTMTLRGPEHVLAPDNGFDKEHPIVSQKKAKKAQREAKRKAKKVSDPGESSCPVVSDDIDCDGAAPALCEMESNLSLVNNSAETMVETMLPTQAPEIGALIDSFDDEAGGTSSAASTLRTNVTNTPALLTVPAILYTTHGKHDHWTRFSRVFVVDQLTAPLLQSFEGCSHGSSCLFESHRVRDCPFHEPHCPCGDPLQDQCTLVHPGEKPHHTGPYNRAHGERLMAIYQQHDKTKGRVMLVDTDLVSYFLDPYNTPSRPDIASMPPRLLQEHKEYNSGYERGPLMNQELEYERMALKNTAMRHPLTMRMLRNITPNLKGCTTLCYCSTAVQDMARTDTEAAKGFVSCSYRKCEFGGFFHKRCVKKLGVEKVSRWYCTACEKKMEVLAYKTLKVPYTEDAGVMDRTEMLAGIIGQPGGVVDRFKSRLQDMYMHMSGKALKVENVD